MLKLKYEFRFGKGNKKSLGGRVVFGVETWKIYKMIFLPLKKVKKNKSYKDNFVNIINFYSISYLFLSFAKQGYKTFIFKVLIQVSSKSQIVS